MPRDVNLKALPTQKLHDMTFVFDREQLEICAIGLSATAKARIIQGPLPMRRRLKPTGGVAQASQYRNAAMTVVHVPRGTYGPQRREANILRDLILVNE
jgi:hypothetical protein